MPFIRLDEGAGYPNLEQAVERVDLGCFGADCGWRGTFATGEGAAEEDGRMGTSNLQAPTRNASHPPPPNLESQE